MPLEKYSIADFSGGINDVDAQANLQANEATKTNTFDVELGANRGDLRTRRGYDMFTVSGASLPSTFPQFPGAGETRHITNMKGFRKSGTDSEHVMMSNADGIIQWLDPNQATNPLVTVRLADASAEWEFIQAQRTTSVEFMWLLNGTSTPQKYDINANALTNWVATLGAVPNGRMLRVWKNQMIVAGVAAQPQRLYFSSINDPESWPASNTIDIKSTDDESDKITALEVIGENLLVFKERSIWVVFDPVTFDNRRVGDVGCVGYKAVCRSKGEKAERIYFVARDGVYSTDGEDEIREESKKIKNYFQGADGTITGGQLWFYRDKTSLVMLWDGKMFLVNWWITSPGPENKVWYCDTKFASADGQHPWFYHKNSPCYISGLCTIYYTKHNSLFPSEFGNIAVFDRNAPSGGAQEVGDYLRNDRTTQDDPGGDSFPIEGSWMSGVFTVTPGLESKERVRRATVYGNTGSVSLEVEGDGGITSSGLIGPQSLSGVQTVVGRFRPETRGRFFRMRLYLTLACRVSSVELEYRGGIEH